MFDIAIRSKTFFERSHLWAQHKMCAIDDLGYCSIDFRLYSLVLLFQVKKRYHRSYSQMHYRTLACVTRSRSVMTRAGTPATIALGATSRVTTAPAPILAPSPMVTP